MDSINGAELTRHADFIRCTLCTKAVQPQCRWFVDAGDGWCIHNEHGTTDQCHSTDAANELKGGK